MDADSGENGRVSYAFTQSTVNTYQDMFSVDTNTGAVFLNEPLDYETVNIHNLEIVATDAGEEPKSSRTNLIIYVSDRNDNRPEITVSTFTQFPNARITESAAVGTFVAHVYVTDADATGSNGRVACVMDHPAFVLEPFQDENQYKIFTSLTFDR